MQNQTIPAQSTRTRDMGVTGDETSYDRPSFPFASPAAMLAAAEDALRALLAGQYRGSSYKS